MSTEVAEVEKTDKVAAARQRLEQLLADGASEAAIARAQNRLDLARHRAQRQQDRLQERAELARGVALKRAKAEDARSQTAAREAESALRTGPTAPTVVLTYLGLRLVFKPEMSGDHVVRNTAREALRQALVQTERHFESVIGTARASAKGHEPERIVPVARLRLMLEDTLRHAIKHGSLEITEEASQ